MLACREHAVGRCQLAFHKKGEVEKRNKARHKQENRTDRQTANKPGLSVFKRKQMKSSLSIFSLAECFAAGLLRSWPRARLTLVNHQYPAGTSGALKWPLHQRESDSAGKKGHHVTHNLPELRAILSHFLIGEKLRNGSVGRLWSKLTCKDCSCSYQLFINYVTVALTLIFVT